MADVNEYEGRNSLLSPNLDTSSTTHQHSNVQYQAYYGNNNNSNSNSNGPSSASSKSAEDNFGDLLAQLLRTLPTDASTLFLKSLSGLSPSDSGELCAYVSKLKDEKQFRVIRAMAESTVDGKKKFLSKLRNKFAAQQAKEQEIQIQEEQELEEHMKRKQALSAAARVKMLNGGAKQYHSSNAVLGAKENVASGSNMGLTAAALAVRDVAPVSRSFSSSSVNITKEDIRSVGKLLGDAHIGESEQNLRELEISKFTTQQQNAGDAGMDQFSKRERPESSRELTKGEEKALQRTRSQQQDPSNDSPSRGSLSDSQDGEDGGEGSNDPEDPDAPTTKRWTKSQDSALRESVRIHGEKNWKAIAELVPGRNHAQCLQRWRKVLKPGLVKGHWSFEEDQVLEFLVTQGCNNWGQIAERIPGRTPKQCRERWKNHLDPAINKGPYTEEEDTIILSAQERLGNKWSQIAQLLKGRTEDSVKIRWKSLKQNPSKAAASHAQQKKNQQHHHHHGHHGQGIGGMGEMPGSNGYPPNAALMRQRQLQLLHQQQQLQQNEAAQQLEQQQQIQQQQLQLRLQEKMMHQQQQLHRQSLQLPEDMLGGVKGESYQQQHSGGSRMLPQMGMPTMSADQLYAYQQQSYVAQHAGAQYGSDAHDYATSSPAGYTNNFRYSHAMNGAQYPSSTSDQHHLNSPVGPSDDEVRESNDSWDINQDLTDSLGLNSRLGENPPPSTFWENYPKQHMGNEPIPIALQSMLQDPNRTPTSGSHHQHYASGHDDDFNDAMFERLATELGSQDFGPI